MACGERQGPLNKERRHRGHSNPISYTDALAHLEHTAKWHRSQLRRPTSVKEQGQPNAAASCQRPDQGQMPSKIVSLPLVDALGWSCAREISSPHSTPLYDTSAMDGFAICSSLTAHASSENPIRFRVVDFIAAGDSISPRAARGVPKIEPDPVCVEIM